MNKCIKAIRGIVSEQCACHFSELNGTENCCCSRGNKCIYFVENGRLKRCKYLEESILPWENNRPVEILYNTTLEAEGAGDKLSNTQISNMLNAEKEKTQVVCGRCNTRFTSKSNRQKYCKRCIKLIRREKQRLLMQEKRKSNLLGLC